MESTIDTMPRPYFRAVDPDGWIRVTDAAERLKCSKRTVIKMIEDGRLEARRGGSASKLHFVNPASIDRLIEANPKRAGGAK